MLPREQPDRVGSLDSASEPPGTGEALMYPEVGGVGLLGTSPDSWARWVNAREVNCVAGPVPLATLVRIAGMGWTVEEPVQVSKASPG